MAKFEVVNAGKPLGEPGATPDGLQAEGRRLFEQITSQWDISDSASLSVLEAACKQADRAAQIRNADDDREWEPDGRRREFLDASHALRYGLGLAGHSVMPTDDELARGDPMPAYMAWLSSGETWDHAVCLRRALLAAAAAQADRAESALATVLAPTVAGEK